MECLLCAEAFCSPSRLPQVIPCGHSFCRTCISRLARQSDEDDFACPICRRVVGADEAAVNWALCDVLGLDSDRGPPAPGQSAGHACKYAVGSHISVWYNPAQRWYEGEVIAVADQPINGRIPRGSVQVLFDLGRRWIPPTDAHQIRSLL